MNSSAASKGSSFAGAVGYITHDIGEKSADRVAFVQTLNMRTNDPEKAAKVMAWTAYHAAELKQAAGIKATGRKTENPVYHFSLNWEPGETVAHNDMVDAARTALEALGYERHEAVLAVHTDKPHPHIHVVLNRIDPETGKTHNPQNDYEVLQRWAYQYEKDRGRVVCLERAIKYEKDKSLKAEYMTRRAAELDFGQARASKPRPQWEAEQDCPFPQSRLAQDIKAELRSRACALAKAGRESASRRAEAWADLKDKHAQERAGLWAKQQEAGRNRRSFERASAHARYSREAYQVDRTALKQRHALEARQLRDQVRAKDAPDVAAFQARQKAAWASFYRMARASGRGELDAALQAVSHTPVGQHGAEHRDHLARVFKAAVTPGDRKDLFAQQMGAEKQAFFGRLQQQATPSFEALKTQQRDENLALQNRYQAAKDAQKTRAGTGDAARETDRRERAALALRQRAERVTLKTEHTLETAAQQKAWADLNQDRAAAWEGYRQHRADQAHAEGREEGQGEGIAKPGDLYSVREAFAHAREGVSRDYGGGKSQQQSGGRQIMRKGPV